MVSLATAAALLLLLFPMHGAMSGRAWQAGAGLAHVLLFAGLAWSWGRALSSRWRGGVLWGGLAVFSAGVEWIQPFVGRSAEWADWLYGAGGAACICGTWQGPWRSRLRWFGVLALGLVPLVWTAVLAGMETNAFPVLADPGSFWSRQGWTLDAVRLSAGVGAGIRIEADGQDRRNSPASYPGAFRAPAGSDWSRMEAFRAAVYWPAPDPAVLAIRVDDRPGDPSYEDRFQREFAVTQGWNAVEIPVAELGVTTGGRPMHLEAVQHWGVFLVSAASFDYFALGEVRLALSQEPP